MARAKDKNGLTHQQELFCQYVVDAYGNNERGILVKAYRMAYNCRSDAKDSTHYEKASRLYNEYKIRARIEQLKAEGENDRTIRRERLITRNVDILEGDPLVTMKEDPETGAYIWKRLNEIPLKWRRLVTPLIVRGRVVYQLDKKVAEDRLQDYLNLKGEANVNVRTMTQERGRYVLDDEE